MDLNINTIFPNFKAYLKKIKGNFWHVMSNILPSLPYIIWEDMRAYRVDK